MTEPLTLHAAVERILIGVGRPLTTREIADTVNEQQLYVRGDGQPVPASQISARIGKYPGLFTRVGHQVALEDGDSRTPEATNAKPITQQRQNIPEGPRELPASQTSAESLILLDDSNFQLVGDVINSVPDHSGVYAIRVTDFGVLPEPFRSIAEGRNDRLIYIGEAKTSLRKRLGQELWAEGHGTLFRSIGAVIGHRPPPGSLALRANKSNYRFGPDDEAAIIRWINRNVEVSWIVLERAVHDTEVRLIREFCPLLNLSGNPRKLPELAMVREECRRIASLSQGRALIAGP